MVTSGRDPERNGKILGEKIRANWGKYRKKKGHNGSQLKV